MVLLSATTILSGTVMAAAAFIRSGEKRETDNSFAFYKLFERGCLSYDNPVQPNITDTLMDPFKCYDYCQTEYVLVAPWRTPAGFACQCGLPNQNFTLQRMDSCSSPCLVDPTLISCGGYLNSTLLWSVFRIANETITAPVTATATMQVTTQTSGNETIFQTKTVSTATVDIWNSTRSPIVFSLSPKQRPQTVSTLTTTTPISEVTTEVQSLEATDSTIYTNLLPGLSQVPPTGTPTIIPVPPATPPAPATNPRIDGALVGGLVLAAVVLVVGLVSFTVYQRKKSRSREENQTSPLSDRFADDSDLGFEDPLTSSFDVYLKQDPEPIKPPPLVGLNSSAGKLVPTFPRSSPPSVSSPGFQSQAPIKVYVVGDDGGERRKSAKPVPRQSPRGMGTLRK